MHQARPNDVERRRRDDRNGEESQTSLKLRGTTKRQQQYPGEAEPMLNRPHTTIPCTSTSCDATGRMIATHRASDRGMPASQPHCFSSCRVQISSRGEIILRDSAVCRDSAFGTSIPEDPNVRDGRHSRYRSTYSWHRSCTAVPMRSLYSPLPQAPADNPWQIQSTAALKSWNGPMTVG